MLSKDVHNTQFLSWVHPCSHGYHHCYRQFLSLKAVEVLDVCHATLTGIVGQNTTVHIVVALLEEHGGRRCVACNLPYWTVVVVISEAVVEELKLQGGG